MLESIVYVWICAVDSVEVWVLEAAESWRLPMLLFNDFCSKDIQKWH
jgi:hypothetical protein